MRDSARPPSPGSRVVAPLAAGVVALPSLRLRVGAVGALALDAAVDLVDDHLAERRLSGLGHRFGDRLGLDRVRAATVAALAFDAPGVAPLVAGDVVDLSSSLGRACCHRLLLLVERARRAPCAAEPTAS